MAIKRYILSFVLIFTTACLSAQNFETFFENKTLRLDYIFSGTSDSESVSLNKMSKTTEWVGRRHNLSELQFLGNGQIIVTDVNTGQTIYKDSFSSLFQEWQSTDEAKLINRSFENVFLVPYPKSEVDIQVFFRQKNGSYKEMLKHRVNPKDILISQKSNTAKYSAIHQGCKPIDGINVVIVPEGYTETEMDEFYKYAKETVDAIFSHEPFGKNKDKFNFYALNAPSKESGVSIPRENIWKETLLHSHFDSFYSERYLTTSNVFDLHDALNGVPYSHIIILANTETYGGGGIFNTYTLTTTKNQFFKPVVVHEFGHSFAGLGDEYFYESGDIFDSMYSLDVEPWEPNITTMKNFDSKWKNLIKPGTPIPTPVTDKYKTIGEIGVFEGGGYVFKGIFRPSYDCRMRTNTYPEFCAACRQSIQNLIDFYTKKH